MTQSAAEVVVQQVDEGGDVGRVNEFFNSPAIKRDLHQFTYRDTLDRAFERADRRLFYIERDGEVVAALMVWCESRVLGDDEAQIRLVAVSPEYRGERIGRSLCERAEQFASNHGENQMSADVMADSQAVEFWKSLGYSTAQEWETDRGTEMYRVVKII